MRVWKQSHLESLTKVSQLLHAFPKILAFTSHRELAGYFLCAKFLEDRMNSFAHFPEPLHEQWPTSSSEKGWKNV